MPAKKNEERDMPAKPMEKKEPDGLPLEFSAGKIHRPPSRGNIPVSFIFEGIYQTAAKGEAKKVAPQEVAQLKIHLDGAVKQLQIIARKLEEREEK
jgi:hypothetical protein